MIDTALHEIHNEENNPSLFGFWVYLMTDLMMFAVLFAAYAVLHNSTFGGPSGRDLFNIDYVLVETIILLISSFTAGLALWAAKTNNKYRVLGLLSITFILGATFLWMEVTEFGTLIHNGSSWQISAFLSSYFALVGTHGFHILVGLFWILILGIYISYKDLDQGIIRKLTMLSLYWHFLDIVWIFIFTIVYLMAVIK
jgi:cytochrome o ubiquinol oxidase subunit 3